YSHCPSKSPYERDKGQRKKGQDRNVPLAESRIVSSLLTTSPTVPKCRHCVTRLFTRSMTKCGSGSTRLLQRTAAADIDVTSYARIDPPAGPRREAPASRPRRHRSR